MADPHGEDAAHPPLDTPPPYEVGIGLERYLTASPGIGGRIKQWAEDFVVEEVPLALAESKGEGKYTMAEVRVRNWETNRLMREIAHRLRVSREAIFFAGTKDKRAITTQFIAIPAPEEAVRALDIADVEILSTTRSDRAPKIGELLGNRFEITAREIPTPPAEAYARAQAIADEIVAAGGFPNYFGVQRFGSLRPVTHLVGQALVAGDLEGAVMTYIGNPMDGENEVSRNARTRLEADRDWEAALDYYPPHLNFERNMIRILASKPDAWDRAILSLPRNLVSMFVYAYQSILFNRILSRRVDAGLPFATPVPGDVCLGATPEGLPDRNTQIQVSERNLAKMTRQAAKGKVFVTAVLFGAQSTYAEGEPGEIERAVIEAEGISPDAFHIPVLPEAASDGTRREILAPVERIDVDAPDDPTEAALRFRFFLPKGTYATCLMREILKSDGVQ